MSLASLETEAPAVRRRPSSIVVEPATQIGRAHV